MGLPTIPTERQLIEVDVASIAMGEIPKTYSSFNDLVWLIFEKGKLAKELEIKERPDPIREVYEKYKTISFPDNSDAKELWLAILKSLGK